VGTLDVGGDGVKVVPGSIGTVALADAVADGLVAVDDEHDAFVRVNVTVIAAAARRRGCRTERS